MSSSDTWPPDPLVLGNRVFHWTCWNVVVNEVIATSRISQLHLTDTNSNESFVLKCNEFCRGEASVGDELSLLGLGDQAADPGRYTRVAWINNTGGGWGLFDFWERQHFSDEQCMARFGLPRKKKALRNLLEMYYTVLCQICLQNFGYTEPELSEWTKKNVRFFIKQRL